MEGKDIFKDNEKFAELYDDIEREAIKKIEQYDGKTSDELSEDEFDRVGLIFDYKFRAQEYLETSDLYLSKIKEA